jgi:hypothetical protein
MSFYTMHFAYATEDWSRALKQNPTQEEDPSTIEVLPEELRPVVDMSKLRHPAPSCEEKKEGVVVLEEGVVVLDFLVL